MGVLGGGPRGGSGRGGRDGALGLPLGVCSRLLRAGWGAWRPPWSRAAPKPKTKGVLQQQGTMPWGRGFSCLLQPFICARFPFPAGYYPPPGPHPPMGYYPAPGHYPSPGGHTATVLVPSGAATTVTVLQGEIFQGAPVQTVCPHCQQAITTKISYEIGLMSFLLGFFCCFVG